MWLLNTRCHVHLHVPENVCHVESGQRKNSQPKTTNKPQAKRFIIWWADWRVKAELLECGGRVGTSPPVASAVLLRESESWMTVQLVKHTEKVPRSCNFSFQKAP